MTLRQRWKQTSLPNKLLVETGALVAFGTLFYGGAAIVQVHVMNQSAQDSATQVDRLVKTTNQAIDRAVRASSEALAQALRQNKEALDAAISQSKESLDASTKQSKTALDASVEASRLDQRAWVGVVEAGIVPEIREGSQMDVSIVVLNSGRTPALKATQMARWRIISKALPFDAERELQGATPEQQGVIQPGGKRILSARFDKPLTRPQIDSVAAGDANGYLFGTITYNDVFGKEHWTKFCMKLRVDQAKSIGLGPCDAYTDAN